jgi:hypothetical protein
MSFHHGPWRGGDMASAGPASVHPVVKPGDTIFLRLIGGFRVSASSMLMMVSNFFVFVAEHLSRFLTFDLGSAVVKFCGVENSLQNPLCFAYDRIDYL